MAAEELDLDSIPHDEYMIPHIHDAIDLASDQDRITWLISGGKRIAAIVPVDVAEAAEQAQDDLMHAKIGGEWTDVGPTGSGVMFIAPAGTSWPGVGMT